MKKKVLLLLAVMASSAFTASSVFAEGSRNLVQNGGNRPYLEWFDSTTLGITRENTMKVFARAGEKILLGSSIYKAYDNNDIVVVAPSGEAVTLDVDETSKRGYISDYNTEINGPYPDEGGYIPLEYEVEQTGIYKIEFHSSTINRINPNAVSVKSPFKGNQGNSVAAFDATVVSKNGIEIPGRGYFDYICLNAGKNQFNEEGLNSDVYVLTNDGYNYKVSFNGINPFGFILFANNRGFIDPVSNTSLYKTIGSLNNEMPQSDIFGKIKILLPTGENTKTNITHKIFLNVPSSDLPESIPTIAELPADVTEVSFTGMEENVAATGSGGLFNVTLSKDATYTVYIDADGNGSFEDEVDVQLANAGVAGKNSIYWNGKDNLGNGVAAGEYNVKATAKGGEYHFPLLDVELFTKGIKVELLNAPREQEDFDRFAIYYDDTDYVTADGTKVSVRDKVFSDAGIVSFSKLYDSKYLIYPANALCGVSSENGALAYGDATVKDRTNSYYGDKKGFDFWTYFAGNDISSSITVKDSSVKTTAVTGNVFYDKNKNKVFDLNENGIGFIKVQIKDSNGKTLADVVTDEAGNYSAPVEKTANGKYVVSVVKATSGYKPTTEVSVTVEETQPGVVYVTDIGYDYSVDVSVDITADKAELVTGEEQTFKITASNNTSFVANNVTVEAPLPAFVKFVSVSDDNEVFDAETGLWKIGTLAANESKVLVVKAVVKEEGEYVYPATISCEGDLYKDDLFKNNYAETDYKVEKSDVPPYEVPELNNNYAYIYGRTDTQMKAEDSMLRGEVSAVIYRLMKQNSVNEQPDGFVYDIDAKPMFEDIRGRWDRSAIEYMTYKGMYTANPKGKIGALVAVKRSEAFKAICIGLNFTDNNKLSGEEYAAILIDAGFVRGDENGDIGLTRNITRAEFCKIYNGIIDRDDAGLEMTDGQIASAETYGFEDLAPGLWYYDTMIRATSTYDDGGLIDVDMRAERNVLDDYAGA